MWRHTHLRRVLRHSQSLEGVCQVLARKEGARSFDGATRLLVCCLKFIASVNGRQTDVCSLAVKLASGAGAERKSFLEARNSMAYLDDSVVERDDRRQGF